MVAVVMVMMPIMMAVTAVMDIPVMMARVAIIIDRRRSDHDRRRADRRNGDAHGCWSRDDDCRSRNGKTNVDSERYACARRGGACGSEGDCYYTD